MDGDSLYFARIPSRTWTGPTLRSSHRRGEQIETGMLHISDTTLIGDVKAPFGGVKGSGNFTRIGGSASSNLIFWSSSPRGGDNGRFACTKSPRLIWARLA